MDGLGKVDDGDWHEASGEVERGSLENTWNWEVEMGSWARGSVRVLKEKLENTEHILWSASLFSPQILKLERPTTPWDY